VLAASRRASKDRPQAIPETAALAAILRDAALTRGPQDAGRGWGETVIASSVRSEAIQLFSVIAFLIASLRRRR
jgi:hypothetical protein